MNGSAIGCGRRSCVRVRRGTDFCDFSSMAMTLFADAAVFGTYRDDGIAAIPGIMRAYCEGASSSPDVQGVCISIPIGFTSSDKGLEVLGNDVPRESCPAMGLSFHVSGL